MPHYTPPTFEGPSKVALWERSLGRLELGDSPFIVEGFQIGSPAIRENPKNRSLADGTFDDTLYHGASAITVTTRLHHRTPNNCGPTSDYGVAQLRDALVRYMHPRLRPRLYWRYPHDLAADGQWAEVRGASWPFVIDGPKYPYLVAQFSNPLGQMFLGDPEAAPNTVTSFAGADDDGRSYDLVFDRDYPDVFYPAGTAFVYNGGNGYADWTMQVHGPFDAGASVVLKGIAIYFNQALLVNEYVTLDSRSKTFLHSNNLSYYPYTNFGSWSWEQLQLAHGDSTMTFDGVSGGGPSGWATIEWYSTSI